MRLNRMNAPAACCHFSISIGSFLYQRAKPPQRIVLFINLLGKGLTPSACMGDAGSCLQRTKSRKTAFHVHGNLPQQVISIIVCDVTVRPISKRLGTNPYGPKMIKAWILEEWVDVSLKLLACHHHWVATGK